MADKLNISAFGTVPIVVFARLHIKKKSPVSMHALVLSSPDAALEKVADIEADPDLRLIAVLDALVAE